MGEEWMKLGCQLGLRKDQIERLKQNYTNAEDQIFNMLVDWKRKQKSDADLSEILVRALQKCGRRDLAANLHQIHLLDRECKYFLLICTIYVLTCYRNYNTMLILL